MQRTETVLRTCTKSDPAAKSPICCRHLSGSSAIRVESGGKRRRVMDIDPITLKTCKQVAEAKSKHSTLTKPVTNSSSSKASLSILCTVAPSKSCANLTTYKMGAYQVLPLQPIWDTGNECVCRSLIHLILRLLEHPIRPRTIGRHGLRSILCR